MSNQSYKQAYEQTSDDEEVEIVSLDTVQTSASPLPVLISKLVVTYPLHLSRRRRTLSLRLAVLFSFLLLIVLLLPNSMTNLQNTISGIAQNWFPSLAPTLPDRSLSLDGGLYIDVSVPWTQVSIDGKPVHIPTLNTGAPLMLAQGRHVISWTATPFAPQFCALSMPVMMGDTCALVPDTLLQQVQATPPQILLLHEALSTLPPQSQAALIQVTQSAFATIQDSQVVQSGESYAGPFGYNRATQRLQATLHFRFNVHALGYTLYEVASQLCPQLCIIPGRYLQPQINTPSTGVSWLALGYISSYWDYTTGQGQVITHGQPAVSGNVNISAYPVLLRVLWNNTSWQVTPLIGMQQAPFIVISNIAPHRPPTPVDKVRLFDDPACINARFLYSTIGSSYSNIHFVSGPHPAIGCLVIAPDSSGQSHAYYFEHLGLLLAANDAAHTDQPQLPLADAYERSLVAQLASLL